MKNFGKKGAWAYPGTAQNFRVPLLSQEREKLQISNLAITLRGSIQTKPIKNFREKGAWAYPETAQKFSVPPIISGAGKATDFKFGQYIQRVLANKKPMKNFGKREHGPIQGLPNFFGYPLLSQERGKLRISNFACTCIGSIGTEAH